MDYIVCLVEFGGHNLNGFTPNSTGRIRLVKLGVNPLRLLPPNLNEFLPKSTSIYLNGFTPNLTQFDQALITQFDQSNWV